MTTRSKFDPSLARKYYDLWGENSAEVERLYARVAELEAAALNILKHTPCSDPDCCSTARAEFAARERLRETLNIK